MKTYIALLRGINVSGQKKIKMADLKEKLEKLGLTSIKTYIQSGNIIFSYHDEDIQSIEELIKEDIMTQYGYDVPVLVLTPEKLTSICANNPFLKRLEQGEIEDKKMYFTLLSNTPNANAVQELMSGSYGKEEFVIQDQVVYFFAANGYGKTKLTNNFFEKKLKSDATTRNLKTMSKLLELSFLA